MQGAIILAAVGLIPTAILAMVIISKVKGAAAGAGQPYLSLEAVQGQNRSIGARVGHVCFAPKAAAHGTAGFEYPLSGALLPYIA